MQNSDVPDPFVVTTRTGYVAFATNSGGQNVPLLRSTDLIHWSSAGDAIPTMPTWATAQSVWAPSVRRSTSGWVMYVTVGDSRRGRSCIFAATSASVTGPYNLSEDPVTCGDSGSIDANTVQDDAGNTWLTWKGEASSQRTTRIRSALLSTDGLRLTNAPTTLLTSSSVGVGNVEGPSVVRTTNGYALFFSVGDWRSNTYRTGYARCTDLTSSCDAVNTNWLSNDDGLDAPGGLEVFTGSNGATYAAFHTGSCASCAYQPRVLNIRRISLDGTPRLL